MLHLAAIGALVWCLVPAFNTVHAAADSSGAPVSRAPLTNDDIVRMVQAGLPANVIETVIKSSKTDFSMTSESLIALTKAGVGGEILRVMVSSAGVAKSAAAVATAAADPELAELCELPRGGGMPAWQSGAAPAVWSVRPGSAERAEIGYERGTIAQVGFAGFGARLLVLHPLQADARIGRDTQFLSCINPADAPLVHFSLDRRSHERNTSVGSMTPFNASFHISPGDLVPFKSVKAPEGYFRISPVGPLKAGEYGFVPQGGGSSSAAGARVYTFGVD